MDEGTLLSFLTSASRIAPRRPLDRNTVLTLASALLTDGGRGVPQDPAAGSRDPAATPANGHHTATTATSRGGDGSARMAAELLPLLPANGHAPGAALTSLVLQRLHAQILLEDCCDRDPGGEVLQGGGSGQRHTSTTAPRSSELPTELLVRVLEGAAGPSPGPGGIAQVRWKL